MVWKSTAPVETVYCEVKSGRIEAMGCCPWTVGGDAGVDVVVKVLDVVVEVPLLNVKVPD